MQKKIKKNKFKPKNGISIFSSSTIKNAYSNFKKNQEKKKIKQTKLKKIAENNQIIKEKKELKTWEEKLNKETLLRKLKIQNII